MGPTWALLAPDGPHVGHMNLAIRWILNTWEAGNYAQVLLHLIDLSNLNSPSALWLCNASLDDIMGIGGGTVYELKSITLCKQSFQTGYCDGTCANSHYIPGYCDATSCGMFCWWTFSSIRAWLVFTKIGNNSLTQTLFLFASWEFENYAQVLVHLIDLRNWKSLPAPWLCNASLDDIVGTWAPSQYKDRLIYVWRFPC